jgi:hypothetical protein
VRQKLKAAVVQRDQQEYQDAIVSAAEAVRYASAGISAMLPRVDQNLKRLGRGLPREIELTVHEGFKYVAGVLTHHTDLLTTLLLQIPVLDYFRFRALVPTVMRFGNGKAQIVHKSAQAYKPEEADFCVTYATEFALKAQAVTSQMTSPPLPSGEVRSGTSTDERRERATPFSRKWV